jgi:hypothetical protein
MSKSGNFSISVWDPYPVWCILEYKGKEIQFSHSELSDLRYAVEKAMQEAHKKLVDCTKTDEVYPR